MVLYYPLYAFFYVLSLLPLRVLHGMGTFTYWLLYHVFGYRRQLVDKHLSQAFPHWDAAQRQKVSKAFYKNFCDLWFEMIEILSLSHKKAAQRIIFDGKVLEPYFKSGKSVQLYAGHFINWEYTNVAFPAFQPFPFLAIYMHLSNRVMEQLVFKLRSRFGSILLRAGHIKEAMVPWQHKQYMVALGADQSPSNLDHALWLYYLNQPTAFIEGPWVRAVALNQPGFYLRTTRIKRGQYKLTVELFEEQPALKTPGELLQKFVQLLERDIYSTPSQYLWTHNRWKKRWNNSYRNKWIDKQPPPPDAS